jgi:hypothetical protein
LLVHTSQDIYVPQSVPRKKAHYVACRATGTEALVGGLIPRVCVLSRLTSINAKSTTTSGEALSKSLTIFSARSTWSGDPRRMPHLRLRPCLALQSASLLLPWSQIHLSCPLQSLFVSPLSGFATLWTTAHKTRERVLYSRHDGKGVWTIFLCNRSTAHPDVCHAACRRSCF